ncbi:DNA-directed RNA polymerase subunit beta [Patescibacteria group bacterium]
MSTQTSIPALPKRKYFSTRHQAYDLPNLIENQMDSYNWFIKEGLRELFDEVTPIVGYTGRDYELHFLDYYLDEPKFEEIVAKERKTTYEAPLRVQVRLVNKKTGEIKDQEIFLGDFPLMTDRGTFIVNGVERVIVSQLIRSAGVFFTAETIRGEKYIGAKVIPNRGAWLEFETDQNGVIYVKIDRKRKVAATSLLRAFGFGTDEEIIELFKDVDTDPKKSFIKNTLKKDTAKSEEEGLKEVYKRIRPGDLATADNARSMIEAMFFQFDRYDFSRVGRFMINRRLHIDIPNTKENRILRREDIIMILQEIIRMNLEQATADDIDHLGNRRIRSVGELIQNKFRIGLARMQRIVTDRMSTLDMDAVAPSQLVNARPVIASVKEFFTNSQLSQFMDQTNPLAELEHKRRLSAMGPGGLSRERAGFDVRDVHSSHYGRICPIETPEGPNIGLVGHLSSYAKINNLGFIEAPYLKVVNEVENKASETTGRFASENMGGVVKAGEEITEDIAKELEKVKEIEKVAIKAFVSTETVYLNAFEEGEAILTPSTTPIDDNGYFVSDQIPARVKGEPGMIRADRVQYVDVAPNEIVSISTSLIPFVEHDDANRALMGSNMQRQAVSTLVPAAPVVGTGIESRAAQDSGQVIICKQDGKIVELNAAKVTIQDKKGNLHEYPLRVFDRSNTSTSINQRPIVNIDQEVKKGDVLADGASTRDGEIALGQNALVAYMAWSGGNYEDAILISERLVEKDVFSSIHIEDHMVDVRDTKLGPEVVTRDIPNVGEEKLKDLTEDGIIRVGAEVKSGDILVGKITPKGETDLTAEERLLKAIFGEQARDVKDTSLYLPHGEYGKVVDVKIFSRESGDKLPTGVIKTIQVSIAKIRKIQVGDKLAGRHGNKGVISRVLPVEDMPHMEDGTTIDIILNPLGLASRMNVGQILECVLGHAALKLGYTVATPVLDGVSEEVIKGELRKAGLPEDGKIQLFDGRSGEAFDMKTTVGVSYILKLHHLVEEKMHQRSIGPYSLVTQQPLGGKAQFGGQRFGEMEVWALEAYGCVHTLQEILTIKSDDIVGRSKTYESIVKGERIKKPNIPESFNVLVRELKSLALNVELLGYEDDAPSKDGGDKEEPRKEEKKVATESKKEDK